MAPEPIEQVVRIVAKSEVDAGVRQAENRFRDFGGVAAKAFDSTSVRAFGSEVDKTFGRFGQQVRTLQPLFGTFRQIFGGFTVFGLVHQGISALIDSVRDYFKEVAAATEQTKKLDFELSLLGRRSATGQFRVFAEALSAGPPATRIPPSQGLQIAQFAASLGATTKERGDAVDFAENLKRIGFSIDEITKATINFLAAVRGSKSGAASLTDLFKVEVTPQNIDGIRQLVDAIGKLRFLEREQETRAELRRLGLKSDEAPEKELEANKAIEATTRQIVELSTKLNILGAERVKAEADVTAQLRKQEEARKRELRQGIGSDADQIKLAIQDASKLATTYDLARQSLGTITQGLQDVTAATTAWAVAGEGGALKLRSLLAGIAGQLAGLITQYIFLRILAGAGSATLPSGGGYPSNFIGPLPAGGSSAGAGLRSGGGSYNAGLRGGSGGGGPSSAGGGGDGNLVVVDDGQQWFNRRLVAAGGLVLQLVQAGKSGNPGFRNGLRSRLG